MSEAWIVRGLRLVFTENGDREPFESDLDQPSTNGSSGPQRAAPARSAVFRRSETYTSFA